MRKKIVEGNQNGGECGLSIGDVELRFVELRFVELRFVVQNEEARCMNISESKKEVV